MATFSKEEARLFVLERLNTLAYVQAVTLLGEVMDKGTKEYEGYYYSIVEVDGVFNHYSDGELLANHMVTRALMLQRHFGG